jgi:hypothetical protein
MRLPRLRVALPWLQDALGDARESGRLPDLPALRWLAGRGVVLGDTSRDWREWLLDEATDPVVEPLRRWPAGPCHARLAGFADEPTACWAIAQPVHLAAGLDHLRMTPPEQVVPTETEVRAIGDLMRAHFNADTDVRFVQFARGAWLLKCPQPIKCSTFDPASIVGRNIHDYMPSGPDGARVRSLMNEIQMLLHDHPVNQRREREGRLGVNALWVWGFGEAPAQPADSSAANAWDLRTDDAWLLGLWQHLGWPERDVADGSLRTLRRNALIAVSTPPSPQAANALESVDGGLLAELRDVAQSGRLAELSLLLGRRQVRLDGYSRLRCWRRPASLDELSS